MRFTLGLLVVLGLAVVVGVLASHTQNGVSAVAVPTAVPTALPIPDPDHVNIYFSPGHQPPAVYVPPSISIHVGEQVTWVNMDSTDHSITADGGAFDSGVLAPGQSYRWTANKPGTYTYSDFQQPDMHGTVVVQP